jgi:hypothetical protein
MVKSSGHRCIAAQSLDPYGKWHPSIALAARHKLPAVYFERFFVANSGLVSYASRTWGSSA